MKSKKSKGMRLLLIAPACFILTIAVFFSCNKKNNDITAVGNETSVIVGPSGRLLSVANVYETNNGQTMEVWFFETPLVYEFSATEPNAKRYIELLNKAKNDHSQVNIEVAENSENTIHGVTEASAEQIANYKKELEDNKTGDEATEMKTPVDGASNSRLVGVIPNMATLNTIFAKLQTQCCKAAGPYIYGQCIPFQYVTDGCYARAHKMRQVVESFYGYTSYKVFNYACNGASTLRVKATLWGNNCCVKWWYHVTTYVNVLVSGVTYSYALDPSMFNTPVSIPTWIAAQKNTTCGYAGAAQGQVYFTSNAYSPASLPNASCVITVTTNNTYTAANATCATYAAKIGCN